jgi:hypothetical protein
LPDGFFSDQKSQFGYILEDLGMENVALCSGRFEYFTTIEYILSAFNNFAVIWYIFPPALLAHCTKKNLATLEGFWRITVAVNNNWSQSYDL